jgi:hypothetical protein
MSYPEPRYLGDGGEFSAVYRSGDQVPELRVRLLHGQRWVDATPGDFLYVPEGGVHAFRNESGEPASMLLLFAPGAPREGYFEGLAGLGKLAAEQRAAFMRYHDTFWL